MSKDELVSYLKKKGWYTGRAGLYLIEGYSGRRNRARFIRNSVIFEEDFWRDGQYYSTQGGAIPLADLHLRNKRLCRSKPMYLAKAKEAGKGEGE